MRLIDENEYQEKLARVPMELRTYRKAVEVALDMPTVKAIPIEKLEQIREDIADLMRYYDYEPKIQKCLDVIDKAIKEQDNLKES